MDDKAIEHIAGLIRGEVSFFNGWSVDRETELKACESAAKKIATYLKRKQKREASHD